MTEPEAGVQDLLPADLIARLAEHATRLAAGRPSGMSPADGTAVAATRAEAWRVLRGTLSLAADVPAFGIAVPFTDDVPVYVLTVAGRFIPHHHGPFGRARHGGVMTVIFDARTLRVLDDKISDEDDRTLLAQLGTVVTLPIT